MKRALIALVAVCLVAVAISIARANSGEQDTSEAKPSAVTSTGVDLSRELTTEQVKLQSEQPIVPAQFSPTSLSGAGLDRSMVG
jgi:hypothetical protein